VRRRIPPSIRRRMSRSNRRTIPPSIRRRLRPSVPGRIRPSMPRRTLQSVLRRMTTFERRRRATATYRSQSGARSGRGTAGAARSSPRTAGAAPSAATWSSITSWHVRSGDRLPSRTSLSGVAATTNTKASWSLALAEAKTRVTNGPTSTSRDERVANVPSPMRASRAVRQLGMDQDPPRVLPSGLLRPSGAGTSSVVVARDFARPRSRA
jgi:hypothetical protein